MLEDSADPFADLASLRISQEFAEGLGVKKLLIRVPTRRPDKQAFFRVHPDPAYVLDTMVVELKEDREVFLAMPGIRELIFDEIKPVRLYTVIDRQANVSIWPCKLPGADGKSNPWFDSAIEVAELAKGAWMRLLANQALGCYEALQASGELPDPEWPDKTMGELLKLAFKDRMIDDIDHPVIRRLKGVH
jgi:hypothetical protein